jgi:hypothetical protein
MKKKMKQSDESKVNCYPNSQISISVDMYLAEKLKSSATTTHLWWHLLGQPPVILEFFTIYGT